MHAGRRFRLGLLTLFAGVAFFGLLGFVLQGVLGNDHVAYFILFEENVKGMVIGSKVNFQGVPIGMVQDIRFQDGRTLVDHIAAGPRVLTIDVEVWPYAGRTGTIVVFVGDTQAQIPVSSPTARTIDVSFTHDSSDPFTAMVELRQGVYDFVVHEVTLRSPGIVVTQQPPRA